MPTDPLDPEFAVEGPTPKPGQAVPPTNLLEQFRRGREEVTQLGAELTGVADVRRVLSGETPWTEAIAGAVPMALGGPEARAAERGVAALAKRYPKVGAPILKDAVTNKPIAGKSQAAADKLVAAGKAYWGKQLTPEAQGVQKQRIAAQRDIDLGNYTPFFKVSERSDVNPTRYAPYKSTTDILPAKPETIKKYMAHASNPDGVARLQAAYEKGLQMPNAGNWYFLGQLEKEFIREYGEGGTGVTAANPKRYNFAASFLGNPQAATIDEQMSKLFDPKMSMPPTGTYGAYHQALNDLANANGVDPRYFQEVAWAGGKGLRDPSYAAGKPMIQEYNEAIERTSRITGVPPAEVVRRGIVRAEMPLYGAAGVIGVGANQQRSSLMSDDASAALGAGSEIEGGVQLAGDVVKMPGAATPPERVFNALKTDDLNKLTTQRTLMRALGGGADVLPIKPEDK